MAINRGNDSNNQNQKPTDDKSKEVFGASFQQTNDSQASGKTGAQSSAPRQTPGLRGMGRLQSLRTGMGRRRPAADLTAMKEAFEVEFKGFAEASAGSLAESQNFKLIMVDRNRLGKKVDLLLAVLPINQNGQINVAIHTMLIADPNDTYEPTAINMANRTLRYSTVVGDVYTADLWRSIVGIVSESMGAKVEAFDAGHQTLPAEMDLKDADAIHKLAFFASEALARTALSEILNSQADILALKDLGENITASAAIDFRTNPSHTAAGLPLRSDFGVTMRYTENTGKSEGGIEKAFDLGSSIPLGGAEGFIDLSYRQPERAGFGQQQQTQQYFARVVLTRLDTEQDFITPELQMLSLLGSTIVGRNLNWARVWSPSVRGMNPGMHDIGALGYEIPDASGGFMGRINTSSAAFDDAALAQLVASTIHERPIISLDVEESGELTWLNRTLLEAAEGNVDANQAVINALNNLTNGIFSRLWNRNDLFAVADENRIHLGYYTDENGERRDIRDLDYLAVLTRYGDADPEMVVKWQSTYDDLDVPADVRLAEREELIRKILGSTVVITGYARRITFHPEALDLGLEAAAEAGLRVRPEHVLIGFGQTTTRGRADLGAWTFGGQGGRSFFAGAGPVGGGRSFNRAFTGRGSSWH